MSYSARVLADSISEAGARLISVEATFPRFVLAEFNTHRVLSRNSASSRAIPPEMQIARVKEEPFVPEAFNERVKGMGVGEELSPDEQTECRRIWLSARDDAVRAAEELVRLNLDKSRVNRLLEPFMWHTVIVSASSWDNFFSLRSPLGEEVDISFPAQPEFQRIAILMRQAMRESVPRLLSTGEWHLPLVSLEEINASPGEEWPLVSAGRAARVSYDTHEKTEPVASSKARAERLLTAGHLSPFEHPARALADASQWVGNFQGFQQLRKDIDGEEDLVRRLEGRPPWDPRSTAELLRLARLSAKS